MLWSPWIWEVVACKCWIGRGGCAIRRKSLNRGRKEVPDQKGNPCGESGMFSWRLSDPDSRHRMLKSSLKKFELPINICWWQHLESAIEGFQISDQRNTRRRRRGFQKIQTQFSCFLALAVRGSIATITASNNPGVQHAPGLMALVRLWLAEEGPLASGIENVSKVRTGRKEDQHFHQSFVGLLLG